MNLIPGRDRNQLASLRGDMDTLFESLFNPGERFTHLPETFRRGPVPPVNVAETEKEFLVSVELPGLDEQDIHVQLFGDQLVISGERKWEQEQKGKEFRRVESQYGSFRRALDIPEGARREPDSIAATYQKGVLEIRLPKVEPKPAAKIPVKAK